MLISVLSALAVALYIAAALALALPLVNRPSLPRGAGLGLAATAVVAHGAVVFGAHSGGLDLHFFAALSVVALLTAAMTLVVNAARPVAGLGVIVFPLTAALLAVDTWLAPPTHPADRDWRDTAARDRRAARLCRAQSLGAAGPAARRAGPRTAQSSPLGRPRPRTAAADADRSTDVPPRRRRFRAADADARHRRAVRRQPVPHSTSCTRPCCRSSRGSCSARCCSGAGASSWRGRRAVRLLLIGMVVLLLAFFGSKFVLELLLQRTP